MFPIVHHLGKDTQVFRSFLPVDSPILKLTVGFSANNSALIFFLCQGTTTSQIKIIVINAMERLMVAANQNGILSMYNNLGPSCTIEKTLTRIVKL